MAATKSWPGDRPSTSRKIWFGGQVPLERVAEPAGEARRVLAPIADERAASHVVESKPAPL